MDFEHGEREAGINVFHGLQAPFLGLIEQCSEFNPARKGIGAGQREVKLARIMVTAVMNGVNLEEA
jgi:hypothetical protein